jgi:hypothetical protein
MTSRSRKSSESGFALLLVFALAGTIAIYLYMELPRVAFEAQRNREQLLIERGEEYKRAIQLYVRKIGRYPGRIEELESTNNVRFLRRRYKDPMTDKDEWRLIHVGPGGVLTDSLVQKQPEAEAKDKKETAASGFETGGGFAPGAPGAQPQPTTFATSRRASDRPAVPAGFGQGFPGQNPGQYGPLDPNQPVGYNPAQPTPYPGGQFLPGQLPPGVQPGQPGDPNQPTATQANQFPPGLPVAPGQPQYGYGTQAGQPPVGFPVQPGQTAPAGFPVQPGQPPVTVGFIQPGQPYPFPQPGQVPVGYPIQPGQQPVGYPTPGSQYNPNQQPPGSSYPPPNDPYYSNQQPPVGYPPVGGQYNPNQQPPVGYPPVGGQYNPNQQPPVGYPPVGGQYNPNQQPVGYPPGGGQYYPNQQPPVGFPPGTAPGYTGPPGTRPGGYYPGQPVNSQTGGAIGYPIQPTPGAGGGAPGQNPALQIIQQILTQPRPGGMAGTGASAAAGNQSIGGGIAGVASTLELEGIKVYNERAKYNEWEFIYDIKNDRARAMAQGVMGGTPQPAGQGATPQPGGVGFGPPFQPGGPFMPQPTAPSQPGRSGAR